MTPKDIEGWIEAWCNLWPADIVNNGRYIRNKPEHCVKKMITFCKNNQQYDKDTIFAATRMYLHEQHNKNWDYTKQSNYFISKLGEPSLLENYCDRAIRGKTQPAVEPPPLFSDMDNFI
jgi:hypothetical protein